jgi:hypothetical protein
MNQFLNSCFYDLGSILDPQMTPKSSKNPKHFLIVQSLGTLLAPKGSPNPSKTAQRVQKGRQTPPRRPKGSDFIGLGIIFDSILKLILRFVNKIFIQILNHEPTFKVNVFVSSFGAVAAWRAQRTGYIRRPPRSGCHGVLNLVSKF